MDGTHGYRISLVLPAYNEEAGLRQAIAEADQALARLADDYEVLVVDDGSRDGTSRIAAEEAIVRQRVRLLRHERNRGYGAALRTGFEAARFELVAFTDADCQFHLDDLARLLPLTASHPVVVGHRIDRQDPWRRRVLSRGYNLLTRTLLGTCVRDCDCALKVFRRAELMQLLPESPNFFVNIEMLARARQLGHAVAEVGVRHRPRLRGRSTVSLREVPRTLGTLLPFWWSRALFVGPAARSLAEDAKLQAAAWPVLLLLLVASLLFFAGLRSPLLEPTEARYAEIPRQMLEAGEWLVPTLHGEPYLDKPPLLYWAVMASYRLFGASDWAARLVPGLAGVLTVLLAYWWGRRTVGPRAALCGAMVLCLSGEFVYRQRMLTMDALLCLWVVASLALAHVALLGGRGKWEGAPLWLLAAVACGLGLLTKGPVALVLVLVPLAAYRFLDRRTAPVPLRWWVAFVGVAGLVAAPWYLALMLRMPGFAGSFFWKHNVVRFVRPFDHAKPVWFYLPGLLLGLLPWALLLPGFVRYLARRSRRAGARRPAALGLFLLSFGWCLLFFSLAGCKRPTYVLPALPPLALALGCYLAALVPSWRALWQRGSRLATQAATVALLLGLGLVAMGSAQKMLRPSTAMGLVAMGSVALIGVVFRRRLSWGGSAAAVFGVLLLGVHYLQPAYNRQFSLRGHLRRTHAQARLEHVPDVPVVCYPHRWDSVSFYLPRANVRVYGPDERPQLLAALREQPDTLLLVKSGRVLDELLRELPGREVVVRSRQGGVAVGLVRAREEAPALAMARR